MHFGEQNGNALFDLSGYIAQGFNAHIWVSVPGSICSNGIMLQETRSQCMSGFKH